MLICPQCTFQNPNGNKFCQSCGVSLTHRVCPECGTEVPVNAQVCHQCGAQCGKVWQAIISVTKRGNEDGELIREEKAENEQETSPTACISGSHLTLGSYLDKKQRYQLLEPLSTVNESEMWVKVLDCQPYQISPIEAILASQRQGLVMPSVEITGVSPLAQAYIFLQSQGHLGIPAIHDVWEQDNIQVLLIEDRSHWQCLLDIWEAETTSTLEILHYLDQMSRLWGALETVSCRQSLLKLDNLRLNAEKKLGLERLYVESLKEMPEIVFLDTERVETFTILEHPLTIQALGEVWQAIFRQSQRTYFGSIVRILEDLELGKIETVEQLRSHLQEIIAELETPLIRIADPIKENAAAPTILQSHDLPNVLPSMELSSLENAAGTDVGKKRNYNEDYFGIQTKISELELPNQQILEFRGLYILCDGMGGHAGGEVASELAVNTLKEYFDQHWTTNQIPTEDQIREAVYVANQAVYELNQQQLRSGVKRMGTTLVMLLIQGTQAAVAHVGDSRLYRLRPNKDLEQMTVDHEVGQREISRGVDASIAYSRPDAYQLTQALGPRDQNAISPDVKFFTITEDSLLLLVSDGLSDNDVLEIYGQNNLISLLHSDSNLEQGVTELIDLANQYNGHDNITVILIRAKVRLNMSG
ncbi:serine/threonine phosphatase [Anabaenopsis tanganyikae CS-531]|uniref:Serine/threonine phosphatase n=2 Tax=Anabaenopsis TaxID=110103 RepID=A0ABT5ALJ6_9CYAN|nr:MULTISPECIES: serine/threonine phosphatase [Anabaenopsis]MDB9538165.1 serine/threonine phosphatase [Anabaenopsis arnoldii]MDH6092476.1 serine/threonine phosphatase [Anabaenopsis arnoldii]MDH6104947.1 serine/threonine phosphatase [Anabaenopsis tanganyikae CS-531]